MKRFIILSILLSATILSGAACQNKKGANTASGLKKVHFNFDNASIMPSMIPVMDSNAKYLKAHDKLNIVVEGHCDERGTNEYNLALGDRRAEVAKDYLVKQGVSAKRVKTVSYGEEQPLEKGHSESAWYMNRRAEFVKQ